MIVNTRYFGSVEVAEDQIILFEEGLPGFPDRQRYVIISENDDNKDLFIWIQSIEDEDVAFALLDVLRIYKDYTPEINEGDLAQLGEAGDEYLLYNIVVIPDDIEEMSVNLLAPVVINLDTKKGKQVILSSNDYNVRYKIFEQVKSAGSIKLEG